MSKSLRFTLCTVVATGFVQPLQSGVFLGFDVHHNFEGKGSRGWGGEGEELGLHGVALGGDLGAVDLDRHQLHIGVTYACG